MQHHHASPVQILKMLSHAQSLPRTSYNLKQGQKMGKQKSLKEEKDNIA